MKYETKVYATLQFEGFHYYPNAPKEVEYLSHRHRHIFHVRVEALVTHDNRDIEFITLKGQVAKVIEKLKSDPTVETWSCEMWCKGILDSLSCLCKVEVSEDGECGAFVERV